jgi:hypothetical protein
VTTQSGSLSVFATLSVFFLIVAVGVLSTEVTFAKANIEKVKQGESPGGGDGDPNDWGSPQGLKSVDSSGSFHPPQDRVQANTPKGRTVEIPFRLPHPGFPSQEWWPEQILILSTWWWVY